MPVLNPCTPLLVVIVWYLMAKYIILKKLLKTLRKRAISLTTNQIQPFYFLPSMNGA